MKREFLKAMNVLSDEQIAAILAEENKTLTEQRNLVAARVATINELTTERDGLKQQVADRDNDIKELQEKANGNDDLANQLKELQAKYKHDTEAMQASLDQQRTDYAVESAFANAPFASALAKKQAMADFKLKGYKLGKDGKYAEYEAYIEKLRKDDPSAFKQEEDPQTPPPPRFTNPMNSNRNDSAANPFGFHFQPVRDPAAGKR